MAANDDTALAPKNGSLALLEEKWRRAKAFGEYLEQNPYTKTAIGAELMRQTSIYRMALHVAITDMRNDSDKKPAANKG